MTSTGSSGRDTLSGIERRVTRGTSSDFGTTRTRTTIIEDTTPRTIDEQTYEIQAGDTLSQIALEKYGKSRLWNRIAEANPNIDPNRLKVGQIITIPKLTVEPTSPVETRMTIGPDTTTATTELQPGTYRIESGDTFSTIALEKYGSENKWVDIAQANPLVDPTRLQIGQIIRLPDAAAVAEAPRREVRDQPAAPSATKTYTIQDYDTLSTIADEFYGDPSKWRFIYNANRQVLGSNPDIIPADVTITIPPVPSGTATTRD